MLRTTNNKVKTALVGHVMANFLPINYGSDPETTTALGNLKEQMQAMQYGNRTLYQIGIDYAEGGSLLVYYGDQRKFLQEILEQTDEEASKFSDDKVFKLYCHLIARTMAKLYTEAE